MLNPYNSLVKINQRLKETARMKKNRSVFAEKKFSKKFRK